jgi:hypothetical protein
VQGNKVIFLGVTDEWRLGHDEDDEVWIAEMQITAIKRFKAPKDLAGYRADQILCTRISLSELEEIKPY